MRAGQTITDLIGTSSVSRATLYRTLKRLVTHGLARQNGETWALTPRALEGVGAATPEPVTDAGPSPATGWGDVARRLKTLGIAAARKAQHAVERAAYLAALDRRATRTTRATVVIRDGVTVLVPTPRPDEIPQTWRGAHGEVVDPATGRIDAAFRGATDGRLILIAPGHEPSYDDLVTAHLEALQEWESAA